MMGLAAELRGAALWMSVDSLSFCGITPYSSSRLYRKKGLQHRMNTVVVKTDHFEIAT